MIKIKWNELSVEKASIMNLFFGKYILAVNKFNESFMLAFGKDRHYSKIVFINCYTNDSYYKIVDSLIEAERISTLFAIDLEQVNSEKVLQKYKFKKIS